MSDKVRSSSGKIYANGTVVIYADSLGKKSIVDVDSRNRTRRTYKINFKTKQKLYDAITYQNYVASREPGLHHCFLTLTFDSKCIPDYPNRCVSDFFDRWKKAGARNYTWVREVGSKGGLVHYHVTTVAPRREIGKINDSWCDCRGSYSPNAVRTAPNRGMVIRNLVRAKQYVSKYMTKSDEDQSHVKGRIYGVSNDLIFEPLKVDSAWAASLIHGWQSTGKIHKGDWSTIGKIRDDWSLNVYNETFELLQEQMFRERLEAEKLEDRKARQKRVQKLKKTQLQMQL